MLKLVEPNKMFNETCIAYEIMCSSRMMYAIVLYFRCKREYMMSWMCSLYSGSGWTKWRKKTRGIIHIHMRSIALISTTALTENRIVVRRNIFHLIVATAYAYPILQLQKKCVRTYNNKPDSMSSFHCTFCTSNFVHFIFRSHSSLFFPYFSDHNNNSVMNSVRVSLFSVMPDAYC